MSKLFALFIAACLSWPALAADTTVSKEPARVAAATLKRTKIVNAAYPRFAIANGMEGKVLLNFTILPDGSIADVEVVASDPVGVFDESAVRALSQWRYEPIIRDGKAVTQPAVITIKFAL